MIRSTGCDCVSHAPQGAALLRRGLAAAAPAVALLLAASTSPAQPATRDLAAAEALFREGRELVKAGDYAAGCPKFEAALALSASASVMLNIAKCHEHEGKIATAWSDYKRARVLNRETPGAERRRDLDAIAVQGISALESRLPKLEIVVTRPPAGLTVSRDGAAIPVTALGTALPTDPGTHEVRAAAPGYRAVTRNVTLEEGKTATVKISLQREGLAMTAEATSEDSGGGGVPTWVWVTGGAGIALAGAGVFFLADDLAAISALRENCRTDAAGTTTCNPGYDFAADNARKDRSFALFLGLGGAGAIAIGVATVGLIRSQSGSEPERQPSVGAAPWIGPTGAGATLSGSF